MNGNLLRSALVAALWLGAAQMAHAQIITFDAHSADFGDPIYDSGFGFNVTAAGWGVFGPGSGTCCFVNYDGTPALYADGSRDGANATIVMTPNAGGTFSVASLDAATYWNGADGALDIAGDVAGGGTVTRTLNVTDDFQHFALPSSFSNLTSLTFTDPQAGLFLNAPGFGLDNINLAVSAGIPEPATWTMMLFGFGGLGVLLRERRKVRVRAKTV